jgi:hypothetical protein
MLNPGSWLIEKHATGPALKRPEAEFSFLTADRMIANAADVATKAPDRRKHLTTDAH